MPIEGDYNEGDYMCSVSVFGPSSFCVQKGVAKGGQEKGINGAAPCLCVYVLRREIDGPSHDLVKEREGPTIKGFFNGWWCKKRRRMPPRKRR